MKDLKEYFCEAVSRGKKNRHQLDVDFTFQDVVDLLDENGYVCISEHSGLTNEDLRYLYNYKDPCYRSSKVGYKVIVNNCKGNGMLQIVFNPFNRTLDYARLIDWNGRELKSIINISLNFGTPDEKQNIENAVCEIEGYISKV